MEEVPGTDHRSSKIWKKKHRFVYERTEASSTTAANCTTVLHGFNGHKWSQNGPEWPKMAKKVMGSIFTYRVQKNCFLEIWEIFTDSVLLKLGF